MNTKAIAMSCLAALCISLCGCSRSAQITQQDMEGIGYMQYSDIDSVCDNAELAKDGYELLSSVKEHILLSFVVDSSVQITEELGKYDHLVMTNLPWIERFADPDKLKPIEYDSISSGMREFLDEQMPLLLAEGCAWPKSDKIHLYQYEKGKLAALPVNVTLGAAEPIKAENPLIILVDEPLETLSTKACLLPLTSSGNVLFENADRIQSALETSSLKDYSTIQKIGSK